MRPRTASSWSTRRPGEGRSKALGLAGESNLEGKILIDISNPLDYSCGMPPSLFVSSTESLAERIQESFPRTKVVKTLNTVNASVMARPTIVADGDHHVFLSGNDSGAKARVTELLTEFGWKNIMDLGDIATARGPEMYLPLGIRIWGATGAPMFNIKIVT